ncbi:MAG: transporter substrate-binding domain-containing protein [Opitutaceae bacterium]
MRIFISASVLLCCSLAGTYGQNGPKADQQERLLIVHAPADYYPYSYVDEQGHPVGFAAELLDLVAKQMHLKIYRVSLPRTIGLEQFGNGKFDILQQYTRTLKYDATAESSTPYLAIQGVLFIRRGEKRFVALEETRDLQLVVAAAPAGYQYALSIGMKPEQLLQVSTQECLRLLSEGKVDAALLSRITGMAQARQLGFTNVVPSGHPIKGYTVTFCFATHRGDSELLALLNDGIAQLIQSGEFEKLHNKWFTPYEPRRFTLLETVSLAAIALALALAIAIWALIRQRSLRKRIARQAEELEESRSILADAQQLAKVGHWLRKNGEGQVSSFAKEILHISGLPLETGAIAVDEIKALVLPEDRQKWEDAIRKLEREGIPYEMEMWVVLRSGERKKVHVRARAVKDREGRCIGSFGTVQDITAWKAVEQALQQSEQLLRALYENLPFALGVVERGETGWTLVSINPAGVRLLGLQSAPAPGCGISSLGLPKEAQEYWERFFRNCIDANRSARVDYSRREDHREFVVTAVPLEGDKARLCFLMEDVTDHRRKDAEIGQSRRLRAVGELVGGIAHEFNNLLTPILLNADLLQSEWAHEPALCDELRVIADAARRSAVLTRKLLAFGRKSEHAAETVALKDVVAANIELVRHTFDRRIAIECDIPASLPLLHVSSGDIHQILLNLLVNARDALSDKLAGPPEDGWRARIHIQATLYGADAFVPLETAPRPAPEAWIRLTVRDNGSGMPSSVMERLYEPFYTTKEVGRGTGLGLATIWHLAAAYGGRVDVETKEGEGTAFHISLPVFSGSEPLSERSASASGAQAEMPSLRVLLVEDEESISHIISGLLRAQGHATTVAVDGRVAWGMFTKTPDRFDAIVMDLNLPGMSGLEFARLVRASAYRGPILVVSGRVSEEDQKELNLLGVTEVLQKPFTGDEVRSALARALAGQGEIREGTAQA